MESSKLVQLPTEMIQAILSALSDISSLLSAALTCRYLYDCLKGFETEITKSVLLQHLNPALLHDAVATRESAQRAIWSEEEAGEFLARYLDPRQPLRPSSWTLSEALPLAQLYNSVRFWATRWTSKVLAQHPLSGQPEPNPRPISLSERTRFERALYRFEIYCNMFRKEDDQPFSLNERFFFRFSPWEHEQLACVNDYFVDVVYPVLWELHEKDPYWLFLYAFNKQGFSPDFIQHQLSFGLASPVPFVTADTYEARQAFMWYDKWRHDHRSFLSDDLEFNDHDAYEYIRSTIPKPLIVDDRDPGPEAVWRWAYEPDEIVFSPRQAPLRKWAYVMWDQERLDAWGIFDGVWEGPEYDIQEERDREDWEWAAIMARGREMNRQGLCEWDDREDCPIPKNLSDFLPPGRGKESV